MTSPAVPSLLNYLMNDPALFHLIQDLTGCPEIGCFTGRVYRLKPGGEFYDSWHSDLEGGRLIAVSVNLTSEPYQGGLLQIRRARSSTILEEVTNTTFGDAIVFRLADDLEHQVTGVTGSVAKTAFAGWFRTEPSFLDILQRQPLAASHLSGDDH
jgi:hypothetical protein